MFWIITLVILGIVCIVSLQSDSEFLDATWSIGLGVVVVVFICGTFITSYKHSRDLESVQYHKERVEIHVDRLTSLKGTLEQFNYPASALLNHDSPVSSIVKQISDAESAIAESKEAVVSTERNIRSRNRWIFSFATWFVE